MLQLLLGVIYFSSGFKWNAASIERNYFGICFEQ